MRRYARHIANAVVKETTEGAYITKGHRGSSRKIDLAIAAISPTTEQPTTNQANPFMKPAACSSSELCTYAADIADSSGLRPGARG
jgi:hypothetical protein